MKNEEIIDYLMSTGLYENTDVDMFYEKKMLDKRRWKGQMLSVQTEILEKSHYDFVNEQKKMLRIEEQLLRIIEELNTQSEQTFIAHIFSLNKLRRVILQEIEGLNSLLTGLDDIRQMYEECERKNMNIDQQVSG